MYKEKIRDLFTIKKGKKVEDIYFENDGNMVRFIQIGDLRNEQNMKYTKQEDKSVVAYPDDIIIAWDGANAGTVHYGIEGVIGSTLAVLSLKDSVKSVLTGYIGHFLKSKFRYLRDNCTGATIPHINKIVLEEIEILIPQNEEQLKIVAILDEAQNLIDRRKKSIDKMDELVQSAFYEMFGDPRVSTKWNIVPVGDVCDCMVPGRDKPKSFSGEIPWITIDDLDIYGYTIKSNKNLGLTEAEINEVKRKKVPAGSVLMSCVGNLGITSIAGADLVINQQLHSFQCGKEINNEYLRHSLRFQRGYMERMATSTTVLYMNKSICNSIPIPLPPKELQEKFSVIAADIMNNRQKMVRQLMKLEENFQSLLHQAFTGQLQFS